MALSLFAHPLSSYCQKVLTALYEHGTPFTYRQLSFDDSQTGAEFAKDVRTCMTMSGGAAADDSGVDISI